MRARQHGHVLAIAAPQAGPLVQAERVPVAAHTERVSLVRRPKPDNVHRHPVTDRYPQIGVVSQGVDPTHDLVTGHHRGYLAWYVAVPGQLGHVAVAQPDRLHS